MTFLIAMILSVFAQSLMGKVAGYQCSLTNVLNKAAYYPSKAYPVLGMTDDDKYVAHFSLWAAMKSPLIKTNVFATLDPQTFSILQDSLGSSATRRWRYFVNDTDVSGKPRLSSTLKVYLVAINWCYFLMPGQKIVQ